MNECRIVRRLLALHAADWNERERSLVEAHLARCLGCRYVARLYEIPPTKRASDGPAHLRWRDRPGALATNATLIGIIVLSVLWLPPISLGRRLAVGRMNTPVPGLEVTQLDSVVAQTSPTATAVSAYTAGDSVPEAGGNAPVALTETFQPESRDTSVVEAAPPSPTPTVLPTEKPGPTATATLEPTATSTLLATPTQSPEAAWAGKAPTAVVTVTRLNLRVGPGTAYARAGQVRLGDTFEIVGRNGEGTWLKVTTLDEAEAWVILGYVQTSANVNGLSVVAAPPLPTPARPTGFGYGVQAHEDTARVCQAINELGFGWLKQQVRWEYVEGSKGQYGWAGLDGLADTANSAGVKVLFSVVAAPSWARGGKSGVGPPDNYQDFYDFAGAMAAHFRGRVQAYEIWNEQNLSREWEGAPLSAVDYVWLLKEAYQAIKAADPNAIVVSGAPTPTGISDGVTAIDDRLYLQQMYNAGLKYYCDAVGAHPSGYANPPDVYYTSRPGGLDPQRGYDEHPSFFFRNTMEDYIQIMAANGDAAKRVWATEFGWPTNDGMGVPPSPSYEFAADINEQQQADYIVRAYTWSRNWGHAGVMFLWNLNFWPTVGPESEMAKYSIVRGDWSPRPAYVALKEMAKQ